MARNDNPGFLGLLFGKRSRRTATKKPSPGDSNISYPYRLNQRFLTPAEHSFYLVAQKVLGEDYAICPQVSLAALFWIPYVQGQQAALNRIIRKRIDYVICDAVTMKILFGVELDDSSHETATRIERDDFVNRVFDSVGLPLLHIRNKDSYNTAELKKKFDEVLDSRPKPAILEPEVTEEKASLSPFLPDVGVRPVETKKPQSYDNCPNCGAPFKIRTSIAGPNVGKRFYVCSRYPDCKTTIKIEE